MKKKSIALQLFAELGYGYRKDMLYIYYIAENLDFFKFHRWKDIIWSNKAIDELTEEENKAVEQQRRELRHIK